MRDRTFGPTSEAPAECAALGVVQRLDAVTVPFVYLRLLGDRQTVDALTPPLDHVIIDRGGWVAANAQAIRLLRQRVPVVAFVNNHFAGYAPGNGSRLREQ